MLAYTEISRIVGDLAKRIFGDANVVRSFAEPSLDADGNDIIRVTIVLSPGAVDRIDDDALLSVLVDVNKRLREAGEERQSVIFYATEEELATSGEPES